VPAAMKAGLNFIRLATPTTDDKRLPAVLANTSGFVYYVRSPASPAAPAPMHGRRRSVTRISGIRNCRCVGSAFARRRPPAALQRMRTARGRHRVGRRPARQLDSDGRATAKTIDAVAGLTASSRRRAGRQTGCGISLIAGIDRARRLAGLFRSAICSK